MTRLLSLLAAVFLSTMATGSPSLAQCEDGPPPSPPAEQPVT